MESMRYKHFASQSVEDGFKVGEHVIESVITRQSAEDLALKQGDSVLVVVKSTEVMIQKG